MPIEFEIQSANWVLVAPAAVPGFVLSNPVLEAAGGRPSQVVQVSDVAIATFPSLQVASVQLVPEQYTYIVTETGQEAPTDRMNRVAHALFEQVVEMAAPIALGSNLVLFGRVSRSSPADVLRRLLSPAAMAHVSANDRVVASAGAKIIYNAGRWRITLSFEQHATEPHTLVASANFHIDAPASQDIAGLLQQQVQLFASAMELIPAVLGEEIVASVS